MEKIYNLKFPGGNFNIDDYSPGTDRATDARSTLSEGILGRSSIALSDIRCSFLFKDSKMSTTQLEPESLGREKNWVIKCYEGKTVRGQSFEDFVNSEVAILESLRNVIYWL
jgi:hypothetical protein